MTSQANKMTMRSATLPLLSALSVLGLAACSGAKQEIKPTPVVQAPVQVRETTAEEHQYAGVEALKANDLAKAKQELSKALAKDAKLLIANYQ